MDSLLDLCMLSRPSAITIPMYIKFRLPQTDRISHAIGSVC